jgi:hypothetical protein
VKNGTIEPAALTVGSPREAVLEALPLLRVKAAGHTEESTKIKSGYFFFHSSKANVSLDALFLSKENGQAYDQKVVCQRFCAHRLEDKKMPWQIATTWPTGAISITCDGAFGKFRANFRATTTWVFPFPFSTG